MRVEKQLVIAASAQAIWKTVGELDGYPDFMADVERWDRLADGPAGVGSRYRVHWKVGSAPVGGTIEVVEYDVDRDLAWTSVTGVNQRGRFRLRDAGERGTCVTLRISYQAPGGLMGLLADYLSSRQVSVLVGRTLRNLREIVEE